MFIYSKKKAIMEDILFHHCRSLKWQMNHFRSYINDAGCGFPFHNELVMPYISKYGTPEQVEKFIPNMAAGKFIGCIAMTEPGAGR